MRKSIFDTPQTHTSSMTIQTVANHDEPHIKKQKTDTNVDSTRPTRAQRAESLKVWRNSRRPNYVKKGKSWTWDDIPLLCAAAQLKLHSNAETHWNKQSAVPQSRRVFLSDNRTPRLAEIASGDTSGISKTTEQKKDLKSRLSANQRKHGQTNWIEAAAIKAMFNLLDKYFCNRFEFAALPDGLGGDVLVREKNVAENADEDKLWAIVQVKSAKSYPGEKMSFHVKQVDGKTGGKYERMIIWALGIDPACTRPTAQNGFDAVADATLTDILAFQNASNLPGTSLNPYPRLIGKTDVFGVNRHTFAINGEMELQAFLQLIIVQIQNSPKFTAREAWFSPQANPTISLTTSSEIKNLEILSTIVGFDNLGAPLSQNETVDVVLTLDRIAYSLSLKTASLNDGGFMFKKGKAPNAQFCSGVMMFYIDRITGARTHVSVVCARIVYDISQHKGFYWSTKNRPEIIQNRISLNEPSQALTQIKQALKNI